MDDVLFKGKWGRAGRADRRVRRLKVRLCERKEPGGHGRSKASGSREHGGPRRKRA